MVGSSLWTGPADGRVLLLAHGAGAAMDSPWLETMSELLAARGIRVARFEFDYMAARRGGVRRPPPKADKLLDEYRDAVLSAVEDTGAPVAIGGKSMGGRVATMVADGLADEGLVDGVVCFGYPFHPPGKPDRLRTAHLLELRTPLLIVQGTRDPFGTRNEVVSYGLPQTIETLWLEDGEHELRPRAKVTGITHAEHLAAAADAAARFLNSL